MISRLARRLRPHEGWDTFLLFLLTLMCLPASTVAARWVPGDEGLLPLAVFALLVGRWLSWRQEWRGGVWLPVGASLGLLASLSVAAHVVLFLPGSGKAAFDFSQRWVTWVRAAFSGGRSEDSDIFLFYAALLCWTAVLLSAWAFYRRQRPLLALLPPVVLGAVSVFYSSQGIPWLIGGLGCGVLMLAVGSLHRERRAWDAAGVDYAAGLGVEVLAVGVVVAVVVVLVSTFGPMLTVRRVSDWFRRTFAEPSAQVEDTAERLFGGVSPPESPPGDEGERPDQRASSYLPESRQLGARPELLDQVVMRVRTDEPPPLPEEIPSIPEETVPPYWRGATMDKYSGLGWSTTVDARAEVEGELPLSSPPAYREVTQQFEFTAPHGDTLYAMNTPVWVGMAVEAKWRISPIASPPGEPVGDLVGMASEVVSYTVISRLPTPTADDLRAVLPLYPPEIVERHLQLPDTVPQRVVDLAWEVVADGETVYDRTRLLERYLRGYPYTLDVRRPPEDRDVVDYFLFDLREGYCDYYATAFVVMARAAGIPARMASGYAGGSYHYGSGAYVVLQRNGHSWPEVYFPGWGWIRFEPTASEAVTAFPEASPQPAGAVPEPIGPPARVVRRRWRSAGLGLVALVGLCWAGRAWLLRRRRLSARVVTLPLVWNRVERAAVRMGLSSDVTLTPHEYAAAMAAELHARARRARRWKTRWGELAVDGGAALDHLAVLYGAQVYGGARASPVDESAAQGMWARLRPPLRWFTWLGWAHRIWAWMFGKMQS